MFSFQMNGSWMLFSFSLAYLEVCFPGGPWYVPFLGKVSLQEGLLYLTTQSEASIFEKVENCRGLFAAVLTVQSWFNLFANVST